MLAKTRRNCGGSNRLLSRGWLKNKKPDTNEPLAQLDFLTIICNRLTLARLCSVFPQVPLGQRRPYIPSWGYQLETANAGRPKARKRILAKALPLPPPPPHASDNRKGSRQRRRTRLCKNTCLWGTWKLGKNLQLAKIMMRVSFLSIDSIHTWMAYFGFLCKRTLEWSGDDTRLIPVGEVGG